jgi:hypothetical protein
MVRTKAKAQSRLTCCIAYPVYRPGPLRYGTWLWNSKSILLHELLAYVYELETGQLARILERLLLVAMQHEHSPLLSLIYFV